MGQSYQNLQILLINDGSIDGCREICNCYAQQDSRIQAVHKPDGGVGSARLAADWPQARRLCSLPYGSLARAFSSLLLGGGPQSFLRQARWYYRYILRALKNRLLHG